jgi:ferredoxin-NADP reductase
VWVIGLIVVLLVAGQATLATWGALRRRHGERRQQARQAALLQERLGRARERRQQEEEEWKWAGFRKFVVRSREWEDQRREIASFTLQPHDGKPIPAYRPGQFLTFLLHVEGKRRPIRRCYSLSDYPADPRQPDAYRVTIKRAPGKAVASSYFLDRVREGTILDVMAPAGSFYLDLLQPAPVVLIGGGIGVTPVLSMLNALTHAGDTREIWFFYGVRNRAEHIIREHLEQVARARPNVHLRVCYSQPGSEDREREDYHLRGRVTVEMLRAELPSSNYDYFICGPTAMMEGLRKGLREWGVPRERIHLEEFTPPVSEVVSVDPAKDTAPRVRFRESEEESRDVAWNTGVQSLWYLARAYGIDIPAGCWKGKCGACETPVVGGEVEYTRSPEFRCAPGTCLPCVAVPRTDLELDVS